MLLSLALTWKEEDVRRRGFAWPSERAGNAYWDPIALDRKLDFTEFELRRLLEDLGEDAVRHLLFYYLFDAATIFFHAMFLCDLSTFGLQHLTLYGGLSPGSPLHRLDLLPFIAALLDFIEDVGLFILILQYPLVHYPGVPLLSLIATAKHCVNYFCLAVGLVAALLAFIMKLVKRGPSPSSTDGKSAADADTKLSTAGKERRREGDEAATEVTEDKKDASPADDDQTQVVQPEAEGSQGIRRRKPKKT